MNEAKLIGIIYGAILVIAFITVYTIFEYDGGKLYMILNEVVSSNIKAVGWEDNKLTVQYLAGTTYLFEGVTKDTFDDLMKADSKGRFINANIKNKYSYKKL